MVRDPRPDCKEGRWCLPRFIEQDIPQRFARSSALTEKWRSTPVCDRIWGTVHFRQPADKGWVSVENGTDSLLPTIPID